MEGHCELVTETAHKLPGQGGPLETGLAVCLDDVGLHHGVNVAAHRLTELGSLNTFSAMVGAPAWTEAADLIRQVDSSHIDAGWHLDFTEYPMRLAPQPLGALMRRSQLRQLRPEALRDEVAAQIDRFLDDVGRWPSHIDGHQHVHQFPQVRDALWAVLDARGVAREAPSLWFRSTRRPRARPLPAGRSPLPFHWKARLIELLGSRTFGQQVQQRALTVSGHLLGVYDFDPTPGRFAEWLPIWLNRATEGDVLMVHASITAIPGDAISEARLQEWRFLSSPAWAELRAASGCRLMRVSDTVLRRMPDGRTPPLA